MQVARQAGDVYRNGTAGYEGVLEAFGGAPKKRRSSMPHRPIECFGALSLCGHSYTFDRFHLTAGGPLKRAHSIIILCKRSYKHRTQSLACEF